MQQNMIDSGNVGSSIVGVSNIKPAINGLRVVCSGYSTGRAVEHRGATRFTIMVSGSTYPHKDSLKQLGLRWDATQKIWMGTVDRSQLQQVESLKDVRLCVVLHKETEACEDAELHKGPAAAREVVAEVTLALGQVSIVTPLTPAEPKAVGKAAEWFFCNLQN